MLSPLRALVIIATVAAVAVPASAAETRLACSFDSEAELSPGLTFGPAYSEYSGSGVVECAGVVDGVPVQGEGTIVYGGLGGISGPANDLLGGDSCVMGSGPGHLRIDIDTETGPVIVDTDFDFVRAGVVGYATAEQTNGVFQFVPETGKDCVFSEIRSASVTGQILHTAP